MADRSHRSPAAPAPAERFQPGTLLWVGPTSHHEFAEAFRFCRKGVAQLAVRRSVHAAIGHPAGFVSRVIFARPTRSIPTTATLKRFADVYAEAAMLALCGQLCDGETRTGTLWPLGDSIRFSRWAERLPNWLASCGLNRTATHPGAGERGRGRRQTTSMLVIADHFETAEPLLLLADSLGIPAAWHRRFIPVLHQRFDAVLWDDSAAPAAAPSIWRSRLGVNDLSDSATSSEAKWPPGSPQPRHVWLALQPSVDEIENAIQGGICNVWTKPLHVEAFVIETAGLDAIQTGPQRIRSA